jgi:hypothetical protein
MRRFEEGTSPVLHLPEGVMEVHLYGITLDALTEAESGLTIATHCGLSVYFPAELLNEIRQAGIEDLVISLERRGEASLRFGVTADGVIITGFASPAIISVYLGEITGINIHRLTAIDESGRRLGGNYNPQTGIFVFRAFTTGSFTIEYVEDLRRINLQLGSPAINDSAQDINETMDVLPLIQEGRTLIPIRFIAEMLGAHVGWNAATREVSLSLNGESLTFAIGQTVASMDVPAQIINDRTFVPLRFIAEHFGAIVSFDNDTRAIEIVM